MRTFFSFSLLLALLGTVSAQFNFFEQMFGGNGGGGQQQHQQQNVPSDSSYYRSQVDRAYCTNYLCPDTLACVHFPHHCPCPWPSHEEKVELADGQRICVSKGGYKAGEAARKVELARKGLL
ncbi:Long chronological lifespan protein 2 [Gnomoniopsis smithogilvyi]|uniref:Long chronological lifespan protein 2 n=1 Tax=Gnomoniopsis smithogilvyi TaxID=1191159 RepID=A0A9W8YN30_9PEZI|nr:Long chronological lifespan protein 2 [Gnomoniopsis smithogilvyi]